MDIPSNADILALLAALDQKTADELESEVLDFKPWQDAKESKKVAVEYAACLANTSGGVVVFGIKDNVRGRAAPIHGVGNYDPDDWLTTIFSSTTPNIAVELSELSVPEGTTRVLVVAYLMEHNRHTEPAAEFSNGALGRTACRWTPTLFSATGFRSVR